MALHVSRPADEPAEAAPGALVVWSVLDDLECAQPPGCCGRICLERAPSLSAAPLPRQLVRSKHRETRKYEENI